MDKKYTRVTDVLSPFSGLKNIDPAILKNAGERGTLVHKLIDSEIMGMDGPIPEHVRGYMNSYYQWNVGQKFMDKPPRFFDDDLMLTGEIDALYVNDDGGLTLVDFKTPANQSKTWALQGSAYCFLARCAGFDITEIEFVKLSKTGGKPKSYFYYKDFKKNWKTFQGCLDAYRHFYADSEEESYLDYL